MSRRLLAVQLLVASALFTAGLAIFRFTCDDAWIAFRYVHNLLIGRGLVWNPAPFPPVEGYTSFAWVMVCAAGEALTGLGPDRVAEALLYASGLVTLGLIGSWAARMPLAPGLERWRPALVAGVLLGIVSNRTFLIWCTSGLEQGFNTVLLVAWLYVGRWGTGTARVWGLTSLAATLALVRPDGLLTWVLTGLLCALWAWQRRLPLVAASPLVVPVLHLLWRRWTYGLWLPNTYYAKHAALWPESGVVYATSFLLEYGFVFWIPLALVGLRRRGLPGPVGAVASAAVLGHFAYYTLAVGGDHFGFRVYHHLIPLAWLGLPWLLGALPTRRALLVGASLLVFAQIVPWTHHVRTNDLEAVEAREGDPHAVHDVLPPPLSWYGLAWEGTQTWLRDHFVCIRYRAHAGFIARQQARYGTQRVHTDPSDHDAHVGAGIGWPGWVLPDALVIDKLGLNDPVVARNPVRRATRKMAHDRRPPDGYVDCFQPNVTAARGRIRRTPRAHPLTAEAVEACVQTGLDAVRLPTH